MSTIMTREDHRREYARLLRRLVGAMCLDPAERDRWTPTIHRLAAECSMHRAYAAWMTEAAADERFGTVLERARDIAETPSGPFETVEELAAALGATVVEP